MMKCPDRTTPHDGSRCSPGPAPANSYAPRGQFCDPGIDVERKSAVNDPSCSSPCWPGHSKSWLRAPSTSPCRARPHTCLAFSRRNLMTSFQAWLHLPHLSSQTTVVRTLRLHAAVSAQDPRVQRSPSKGGDGCPTRFTPRHSRIVDDFGGLEVLFNHA